MTPNPQRSSRRRWWRLLGGGALVLLLLPVGCSVLGPAFEPAIDTAQMRASELGSRFVDSGSGRLHFVVAGRPEPDAVPVLFVHGSPGTWDAWQRFLEDPELRAAARLIALDRPGFGGSERGLAEPSLVRQAAALAAVLGANGSPRQVSSRRAIVVGHSLGGPIAVRLAIDRPELVAALVLVAPSIDPALERRRWYNFAAATRVVQWFLPIDWTVSNRELWPLESELKTMLPRWPEIRCPVIVVQGLEDDLVPAANADFAERQLPAGGVRVDRYPDAGHFLLWQRPETVRRPVLELLARPGTADAD